MSASLHPKRKRRYALWYPRHDRWRISSTISRNSHGTLPSLSSYPPPPECLTSRKRRKPPQHDSTLQKPPHLPPPNLAHLRPPPRIGHAVSPTPLRHPLHRTPLLLEINPQIPLRTSHNNRLPPRPPPRPRPPPALPNRRLWPLVRRSGRNLSPLPTLPMPSLLPSPFPLRELEIMVRIIHRCQIDPRRKV